MEYWIEYRDLTLVKWVPDITPLTSNATGQCSKFLEVLYLALTGLIDSALPAAGPWAVAGKAIFYLVKLSLIIWWAMPMLASAPPISE
ncbi:hypothetical protein DSO57_1030822, partial [Entomophthora muscae]